MHFEVGCFMNFQKVKYTTGLIDSVSNCDYSQLKIETLCHVHIVSLFFDQLKSLILNSQYHLLVLIYLISFIGAIL